METTVQEESRRDAGVSLVEAQRTYATRPDQRQAEHVRLLYSAANHAGEVRASISWEALAQLRSEMARAGETVEDTEMLELVLIPWALDQLEEALALNGPSDEGFQLDFGDAPRPPAVRETLLRYGLLTDE